MSSSSTLPAEDASPTGNGRQREPARRVFIYFILFIW